jgi:hypothetical protein
MALVKENLTTEMINAVSAIPDGGAVAMQALGDAIVKYLCDNTTTIYAWVGVNPKGDSDPVTTFNAELQSSGVPFTTVPADFNSFISSLALYLNTAIIIQAPSDFTIPPLNMGTGTFTAEQLGELSDNKDADKAQKEAFGKIAQGIIDGWRSYFMPSTGGSHSAFTGNATLTAVS